MTAGREAGSSVLIVEDEIIAALYLKSLLSPGYRVVGMARSGEEAVSAAAREAPDIVIMDVHLEGGMDGIEAARRIREDGSPAVVFCSAFDLAEMGDPVASGLGVAFLPKPIERESLLGLLSGLPQVQPS